MSRVTCPSCQHDNESGAKFCSQCAKPLPGFGPPPERSADGSGSVVDQVDSGKRTRGIIGAVLMAAVVPFFGIMVIGGDGCGGGSAEGHLRSTGLPHGDFELSPTSCYSGQHEDFFGVWVAPEPSQDNGRSGFKGGLKLVKGHTGEWEIYVESPIECESFDCTIRPLSSEHCSMNDIEVRNTSTYVNEVRVREGHAKLECAFPEGGTLSADLTFRGCH